MNKRIKISEDFSKIPGAGIEKMVNTQDNSSMKIY